ncbi:MAG: hypothetical protein ACI4I9_08325 [Porcipelethomonas sp.]
MKKKMEPVTAKEKILKKTTLIIKIAAILTTLVFPCIFNILSAAGWIYNSGSYGEIFNVYGAVMIVSSAVMAAAAILCCLKLNIAAVIADFIGLIPCMTILYKVVVFADENGWSNKYTMEPVSNMYRNRILPTIIPFVLIIAAAALQFFSYEAAVKRRKKREEKEKRENMPAPKILDD